MGKFTKFSLSMAPFIFSGILLSSCAQKAPTAPKDILEPTPIESGYKRSLQIITDDADLASSFNYIISEFTPEIVTFSDDSFTEFRLILSKKIERVKSLETKPRLLGYIQKDQTPVHYKLVYSLQKTSGHTLAEGEIEEFTETEAVVYPNLSYKTDIDAEKRDRIVSKVLNEIRKSMATTAWSAEIIGQKDPFHVTMSGDSSLGLNIGDRFITKTQPISTLELAMFEPTGDDNNRPVLRLLSGPLPTTGKSLAPIDAGKPIK